MGISGWMGSGMDESTIDRRREDEAAMQEAKDDYGDTSFCSLRNRNARYIRQAVGRKREI